MWARREARAELDVAALRPLIDDTDRCAFVGNIDGTTIGVATAHIDHLLDGGLLAVVDELFVEAGAREVSVGEMLMDAVVAWATERGCFGIDATVLPGNRETKNFFETFGLTARAIVVHRSLATES